MLGTALAVAPGWWPGRAGSAAGATPPEGRVCLGEATHRPSGQLWAHLLVTLLCPFRMDKVEISDRVCTLLHCYVTSTATNTLEVNTAEVEYRILLLYNTNIEMTTPWEKHVTPWLRVPTAVC